MQFYIWGFGYDFTDYIRLTKKLVSFSFKKYIASDCVSRFSATRVRCRGPVGRVEVKWRAYYYYYYY